MSAAGFLAAANKVISDRPTMTAMEAGEEVVSQTWGRSVRHVIGPTFNAREVRRLDREADRHRHLQARDGGLNPETSRFPTCTKTNTRETKTLGTVYNVSGPTLPCYYTYIWVEKIIQRFMYFPRVFIRMWTKNTRRNITKLSTRIKGKYFYFRAEIK